MFAQADDCSGEPSVTHVSNRSGRPPAPPSSAFTYPTAASAASRASGSAAGPLSWEIIAITIGSPFGAGSVVAAAAGEAGGAPAVTAGVAPDVSFGASVQLAASPATESVPARTAVRRVSRIERMVPLSGRWCCDSEPQKSICQEISIDMAKIDR